MKKIINIRLISISLISLWSTCLYATEAAPPPTSATILTIEAATKLAIEKNPGLAEIRSRYKAMTNIPSQKGSLPDPMLTLGAANFPTDSFSQTQEPMAQLQLGFSQVIPFPGKLRLKEEAAELDAKAASYSVNELQLQLVLHVTTRWWQIFYLDRATETIHSNQALLRQFIEVAKTKYETGKGLQQDVLLSQLELSKLIDQDIQIKSMRRSQSFNLNRLMDRAPQTPIVLPLTASSFTAPLLKETQLYKLAEKARPILKQQEQKMLASNSRLSLAKRDFYPDFKLSFNYGERTGDNPASRGGERPDLFSVKLGIKVPLYAGTKQSKAVQQRSNEYQQYRYSLLDEKNQVKTDISTAISDFHQSREQTALFKDGIIPQARQTVQSMLAGYQVGVVDFLNLVRSQVTLFNYELQYWKSLAEAKQALSRLQATVGEDSIYE